MIETILQGILGMLSAINGEEFFLECYTPLGEVNFIHAFQLHRNDITFIFISSQAWCIYDLEVINKLK